MSYSADHEGIIIRKSVPAGSGDLRSHHKVVAEQRIPCSARNAWAFNLTLAGLDLHAHAQSLERRKDYFDGPSTPSTSTARSRPKAGRRNSMNTTSTSSPPP